MFFDVFLLTRPFPTSPVKHDSTWQHTPQPPSWLGARHTPPTLPPDARRSVGTFPHDSKRCSWAKLAKVGPGPGAAYEVEHDVGRGQDKVFVLVHGFFLGPWDPKDSNQKKKIHLFWDVFGGDLPMWC